MPEMQSSLSVPTRAMQCAPWPLNRLAYRARNATSVGIKRLRGVATRYHKLAHVYLNHILFACIHFMTKWSEHTLAHSSSGGQDQD